MHTFGPLVLEQDAGVETRRRGDSANPEGGDGLAGRAGPRFLAVALRANL